MAQAFGHVAIAYQNINANNFESFDQNWNAQVGEIINHDYNYILGFLRFKNTPPVPPTPPTPSFFGNTKFKWVLYSNKLRERRRSNAGKRF